ncbi:MAG TPA: adenylate/guanylate cyclase domain-containing protein [Actinomycetota bacterium]|jgi:class 3 adenylate cyclase/streptogramin lyase|nr:adenylate/guanylate cyclase domain-containing protein [Actinomycetota bacterium]
MQRRGVGLGAVLFTDIVGSTAIAAEMGNTRWSELVERHHRIVRRLIARYGGHEVDTAGDGFFVTFERPADAIRCAVDATEDVRELGIEIRAGVTFGELGAAGKKPSGLMVNTAARVMAVAGPGEVLVPGSVKEIVPGTGISFVEHGVHRLKGLDEEFRLHLVTGVDGHEVEPPLEETQAAERRREIFPTAARRRALLVGLGAGVLALIAAALLIPALLADEEGGRIAGPVTHSVARIDASTGAVESSISLGHGGPPDHGWDFVEHPLAAGEGGVWLMRPPHLLHLDPLHEEVRSEVITVGIGESISVETGADAVWALRARVVYRVHPGTGEVRAALILPVPGGITTWSLALGRDLWVGVSDGTLVRLDPFTGARDQVDTGLSIDAIAATKDAVWVGDILAGALYRFDVESLRREDRIQIRGNLDELEAGDDGVWVLDRGVGVVSLIDETSNSIRGSARVGDDATDLAADDTGLWVSDGDGSLYHVDPVTMEARRFSMGAEVIGVAVDDADGAVWVYLGEAVAGVSG